MSNDTAQRRNAQPANGDQPNGDQGMQKTHMPKSDHSTEGNETGARWLGSCTSKILSPPTT